MRGSWFITLGRALFVIVGAGAVLLTIGNLAGGASISDPVVPLGIGLGILAIAAGLLTTAPALWQALLAWLGIAVVVGAVAYLVGSILLDPDVGAEVYPVVIIPAVVALAAAAGVALGRMRAGALGARTERPR